jgi:signal transduction histidine kinase
VAVLTSLPLLDRQNDVTAAWLLSAALVGPLVLRRNAPLWTLSAISAAATVQLIVGIRLPADLALLLALFTVASRRPRRHALAAVLAAEILGVLAAFRIGPSSDGRIASVLFTTGLLAAAFFAGTAGQERRSYLASVLDRAERLEREQHHQAQLAVTAERTRIAREMHDIVAHSLTVMITLAEAARSAHRDPEEPSAQVMGQVAATGREAMIEMRRLLGVLRHDDTPPTMQPQPGLAQLQDLIVSTRAAGLPVRLTTIGVPRPTDAAMETTVYRITQEALTNVLKHAQSPTEVVVNLTWADHELDLTVTDDGQLDPQHLTSSSGQGLLGMVERATVFGGSTSAGAEPTGWRVHTHLPLHEGSP